MKRLSIFGLFAALGTATTAVAAEGDVLRTPGIGGLSRLSRGKTRSISPRTSPARRARRR
jgi:hypothetical protein